MPVRPVEETHPIESTYGRWKNNEMLFPKLGQTIFVDIETNMEMTRVWLIGAKLEDDEQQWIANNWSEERQVLLDFARYLNRHPGKPLVCYSTTNFDFRVLLVAARRYSLEELSEALLSRALIDMGTLLRRHFKPKASSYSLKMIRFLIGYRYDDISISGADVATQYYREVRKYGNITEKFRLQSLRYNLDDIRILYDIITKFSDHISFTDSYQRTDALSDLRSTVSELLQSSTISDDYIRLSFPKTASPEIMASLMSHGLPLPEVKEGKNVTAMYWKSQFAFTCMEKLVGQLDLEQS
ncbi:MAG: ribonuclease H-like domain-containing protein [Candidatus Kariarchaeaceae archaeon]